MTDEDVLVEFAIRHVNNGWTIDSQHWQAKAMASEIVKVRQERDALRELLDKALKNVDYWLNRAGKAEATLTAVEAERDEAKLRLSARTGCEETQRILAALRGPSDSIIVAMQEADSYGETRDGDCIRMLWAAIEVAEREAHSE